MWPFAGLWSEALSYDQFVKASTQHCGLWTGVYQIARVPEWAVEAAARLPGRYRLVVLAEDWCGDATNTVPILAKWAAQVPGVELRVLRRDEHPELMNRYLTGTARSIPVVIVLTEAMEELGWWGPRPTELQAWVRAERAKGREKKELYPEVRRWYAKDRGAATLREVLAVMQPAGHTQNVAS
jgi:hypothetical protein